MLNIELEIFIFLSFYFLFFSGINMVFSRNNMLYMLIFLEVLVFSSIMIFIPSSCFFYNIDGQILAILVLAVAASESIIALSLLVIFYKLRGTIDYLSINLIKG
jgi:NADH:ubiquinone oxidoreductase subunit K